MKSNLHALNYPFLRGMILTFCALLFCVISQAQTTRYVAKSGSDVSGDGTFGKPYLTISKAVGAASTINGDIVKVGPGTYNEQVLIKKAITIDGQDTSKCIVTFSGTATGVLSLFTVYVANVTIKNFQFDADLSKINSAIMNSGSATNLLITGNEILSDLSISGSYKGSYGTRNGISLNSGSNIIITSNTIDSRNGGKFRAALFTSNLNGLQIGGSVAKDGNNFFASVNHDALLSSYQGNYFISNNNFNGGGVEVANSAGIAAGSFTVINNTFDGTYAHTIPTAMVRIFTNADPLMTVNFSYNHFINQKWTVSFENTRNVTLDHNDFTAVYDSFRLISVNTKLRQSSSPPILEPIDIRLTNNNFSAIPGITTGNALEFLNFDEKSDANKDKYILGNYVIGDVGNENNFNENIPTFVYVSNLNGYDTKLSDTFLNLYPEYKDVQTETITGYWARDIFARYNRYYINGSLKLASDFSASDFKETYKKIFDRKNDVNIGAVVLMPTWSGANDTDWSNASNWSYQFTPKKGLDAVVYPQVRQPQLTVDAECDTLIVYKNMTLKTGNHNLTLYGNIRSNGTVDGNIIFAGTTIQSLTGSMQIKNFTLNNSEGIRIEEGADNQVRLTGTYTPGNAGVLVTNDNLVLHSDSAGTAIIGKGIGNYISGSVIYERFINTGTSGGQHKKSWQFLSTPVGGQSIKESWMENGVNVPGYGIQLTGPGGIDSGFDSYSVAPSIKYYNYKNNNWLPVTNTNQLLNNNIGYFVFIRGDRTVTGSSQPATTTTLRVKGPLSLGTMAAINVPVDNFQTVGNPYASPVDFSSITKSSLVDDCFYLWDPYLYGSYGVGGYQLFSATNGWEPVPGGTVSYPSGVASTTIQSGQAFFVHATSSGTQARIYDVLPSDVTFTEDAKINQGSTVNVMRKANKVVATPSQALRVSLYTGPAKSDLMADGNSVVFDQKYSDKFDRFDALKIVNSGENFGLKNNGKLLSVDARSSVSDGDTLYYNMSNLARQNYELRFSPVNLQNTGLKAVLVDKFLNTETPVSLTDSTFITVAVTSNSASGAADRFKVVFRQMGTLAVTITSINATAKDANNIVQWSVANESGVQQYEVEKSIDGNRFTQIAIVNANNTKNGNYDATDKNVNSGINFYRIKIVNVDGKPSYTTVVKVVNENQQGIISVYPNPVINNIIHLQINNQPEGIYKAKVCNSAGQVLISKSINHSGNAEESINCENLPTGIYQLHINKPDGKEIILKIVK